MLDVQLRGNRLSMKRALVVAIPMVVVLALLGNEYAIRSGPLLRQLSIADQTSNTDDDDDLFCTENPYTSKLAEDWETISSRMDAWLEPTAYEAMIDQARNDMSWHPFEPFNAMASCQTAKKTCVGGACHEDESKITCGLSSLQPGCIVYSIGGNNQWGFEKDILEKTPCDVHTFDCTGPKERFHPPAHNRLHFHHVCLGSEHEDAPAACEGGDKCGPTWTLTEIQETLGHKQVDLHKMDIEGFEWSIFESWKELSEAGSQSQVALPMQLLVEVHYVTQFSALGEVFPKSFKKRDEIVELQAHLLRMGYIVIERDDNMFCPHCTELTLLRIKCPRNNKDLVKVARN